METSPRIFISYSRADGRDFAEALERRLADAGIRSWRDLKNMGSGEIRPQVLRAIEETQHLVLILSRCALASDWVKREWTHAREWGRMVSPVLADPTLERADLPVWMRRAEVYDIADPERWQMLKQVLLGSGETRRVPYMAGDLAEDFVPRPTEYARLKQAVLAAGSDKTVAVTTALRGAGGYGKTTLASFLCRDPDVRFEFTDGILRVEIGKEREDVTGLVIDLIETLDPEGRRPGFQDVQSAAEYLSRLIGEARLLLVIDDVWREAQLRPFLRGGPNCARLVTTRLPQVLREVRHTPITIDAMQATEALNLIAANLPNAAKAATRWRLAALADRLGSWARMLGIANGWMRERVAHGELLGDAITRFERRLSVRGLTGFDLSDERQRNREIRACVEASLEELAQDELGRLGELAVLPASESVPLGIVEALWRKTGDLDEDETDDLVRRLHGLSLLQSLDLAARTLRLHHNMIWYLRDRIGAQSCQIAHAAMVESMRARCEGKWETLPPDDTYGWRFLIRHLRGAGQDAEADRLLTDFTWIKAKLRATGPRYLLDSYLPASPDAGARLVGRAIALSLPALAAYPRELPRQLYGRLGGCDQPAAAAIVTAARLDQDFHPAPRWPGLTWPGAEPLRFVGHQDVVNSACFSPDGARIVTASWDRTARLWDVTTGQQIAALRGHDFGVRSACFSPDGARIVTASSDYTARLWDATAGQELAVLRSHDRSVNSACFSPDGDLIVTASGDGSARLWDAGTGRELVVLRGHEFSVRSACFSPDGARIVTASWETTARLWHATTGRQLATLRGHTDSVWGAWFSPDGDHIVTVASDRTARLWDSAIGQELTVLRGHENYVWSACFSADGARIVTTSGDRTARIWDVGSGQELMRIMLDAAVTAVSVHDGTIVLGDRLGRIHVFDADKFLRAEGPGGG